MGCREIGGGNCVARLCFEYLKTPLQRRLRQLKTIKSMKKSTQNKGGRPALPDYKKKANP